ncbi:hypothetical protein [Burkholderia multivorans]|nr:hypothetical protein [Burkholderia multivorans]MBU9347908.1 hypothetical protein [Burkholderia multivorans]
MNSKQSNAATFAALHRHAVSVFGADQVGEYVTEVAGFPWFALALGGVEMVAEYHEDADRYVLNTCDGDCIVSRKGAAGAFVLWNAMCRKARASGELDGGRGLLDRLQNPAPKAARRLRDSGLTQ